MQTKAREDLGLQSSDLGTGALKSDRSPDRTPKAACMHEFTGQTVKLRSRRPAGDSYNHNVDKHEGRLSKAPSRRPTCM